MMLAAIYAVITNSQPELTFLPFKIISSVIYYESEQKNNLKKSFEMLQK